MTLANVDVQQDAMTPPLMQSRSGRRSVKKLLLRLPCLSGLVPWRVVCFCCADGPPICQVRVEMLHRVYCMVYFVWLLTCGSLVGRACMSHWACKVAHQKHRTPATCQGRCLSWLDGVGAGLPSTRQSVSCFPAHLQCPQPMMGALPSGCQRTQLGRAEAIAELQVTGPPQGFIRHHQILKRW